MKVLHVCATPIPTEDSVCKQLAMAFFIKLTTLNSEVEVENIDLDATPPPPYTYDQYRGCWFPLHVPGYVPTKDETNALGYAKEQAEKFCKADVLVLTTPMWNYSIPGNMKSWIDHVAAPGLVYSVNEDGSKNPLHQIKRLILIVTSDAHLDHGDSRDCLTPLIENVFGSIGIDDISVAWADGQATPNAIQQKQLATEAVEEHAEEVAED